LTNDGIELRDVPARLFNPVLWNEYRSLLMIPEDALAELGRREHGIFGYYRQETPPWLRSPAMLRHQRLMELQEYLVGWLREQLVTGKLVATGFTSLAVERVPIPAHRWQELRPDFANNKARDGTLEFTAVRISEPAERPIPAPDLLDLCTKWMQERAQRGESLRKVLASEAMERFGQDLTTRIFDAAYTRVFSKRRGRPRKNPNNPQ
jgi:hypothetical protein